MIARAAIDDLAVEIAGGSAQIALLVGPVLVLFSVALGHPMSLLFNAFEITGDRAVGHRREHRRRRRREQLGRGSAADGRLSHPRPGVLFRAAEFVELRVDAIIGVMGELSDRLIAELVDAVRVQLRKEAGERLRDVYLIGDIEKDTARTCIERLRELAATQPADHSVISTPWRVTDGLAIHDSIRHIISRGIGSRSSSGMASMGSIVLQAASEYGGWRSRTRGS